MIPYMSAGNEYIFCKLVRYATASIIFDVFFLKEIIFDIDYRILKCTKYGNISTITLP